MAQDRVEIRTILIGNKPSLNQHLLGTSYGQSTVLGLWTRLCPTSSRVTKIHLQMTTKQGQLLRLQESVGCCGSPEKAEVPAGGQI